MYTIMLPPLTTAAASGVAVAFTGATPGKAFGDNNGRGGVGMVFLGPKEVVFALATGRTAGQSDDRAVLSF